MKSPTDLGVLTGAFDLERLIIGKNLRTPHLLPDGTMLFVCDDRAERVELATWMPSFPATPPFTRLAGSDVWVLSLTLPRTAMIEYRLRITRGTGESVILDPLNPDVTTNPFGVNSVARGPDRVVPVWTRPDPEVAAGDVGEIRVRSGVWGERRHHLLYLPAGHDPGHPHPLLVVHDGGDFLDHSSLSTVLDNLIATGTIPPVVALLHQPKHRLDEYTHDPRHTRHLLDELVPHVRRRAAITTDLHLMGSSLGAVASLAVAIDRPEAVTGMALISGTFPHRASKTWPSSPFAPVIDLVGSVGGDDHLTRKPIFVSCGRYEGLIDLNRHLVPRLRSAGADVVYEETWDGHQWGSWRDRLRAALVHLLG